MAAPDLGALIAVERVLRLVDVDEADVASEDLLTPEGLGANFADVSRGWNHRINTLGAEVAGRYQLLKVSDSVPGKRKNVFHPPSLSLCICICHCMSLCLSLSVCLSLCLPLSLSVSLSLSLSLSFTLSTALLQSG